MSNITVTRTVSTRIPSHYGEFELVHFNNTIDGKAHLAFCIGDLGIKSMRLITNNSLKIRSLEEAGIKVSERVEMDNFVNPENSHYLLTEARRMNHLLPLANTSTDN